MPSLWQSGARAGNEGGGGAREIEAIRERIRGFERTVAALECSKLAGTPRSQVAAMKDQAVCALLKEFFGLTDGDVTQVNATLQSL